MARLLLCSVAADGSLTRNNLRSFLLFVREVNKVCGRGSGLSDMLTPGLWVFLLVLIFVTAEHEQGPGVVKVKEGDDVILPCSLSTKENIEETFFDWSKDDKKEVFYYDSGLTYNNGRPDQDEQFRGRVSHFEDELKNGNASIKILNTKTADSGNYTCFFPHFQPRQTFHIELIVELILKDRSHIPEDPFNKVVIGWLVAAAAAVVIGIVIAVVVKLCIEKAKLQCSDADDTAHQANGISLLQRGGQSTDPDV